MIVSIIPAYNEEKTIGSVIKETKKFSYKIIVIDDCSSDRTYEIAKKSGIIVIRHRENGGLGSSIRTGVSKALSIANNNDIIITLDADGQHNPRDIPRFIEKIKEGYDFVLGKRDLRKYPLRKKFGNFLMNLATNFVSGTNLKDTESGFRAFKVSALRKLYLKAKRYEIAVEIIFEVGRNNLTATNIPISSPVYVKGVGVWDGIKNFRYLLSRRRRTLGTYFQDIKYVLRKKRH